nr:hypothetical protein [Tanacetum cinerariifolium]
MVKELLEDVVLAKESSQPQSSYEAATTLIEFELKKIMINKMDKCESYLAAPEHRECYEGLKKSYDLDKTIFSTYGKMDSLKRSQKDKDEDPSVRSDRGLKKRKTSKDAKLTKGPKAKESQSGSSKGNNSHSKSFGKSIHSEEPKFEVADSDMPQDQEVNPCNNDEEPNENVASKRDWFTKPTQPQEPTDPDWNRDQRKSFYGYARGLKSRHDVYSTKRIMAVTRVEIMKKHGYGYLKEIEVQRANNDLYTFKEGDFPRLRINDIEDMLLLVV